MCGFFIKELVICILPKEQSSGFIKGEFMYVSLFIFISTLVPPRNKILWKYYSLLYLLLGHLGTFLEDVVNFVLLRGQSVIQDLYSRAPHDGFIKGCFA